MPEEALLDAAVETPAVETTTEIPSTEVSADSGTSQLVETPESDLPRGQSLWRDVKDALKTDKPLTADQKRAIRRAISSEEQWSSKYPDGLKSVESQIGALRQLADDENATAEQIIESTLSERNYFRELDSLFTAADPKFADKMAEASPEAFENLFPAMMKKYSEISPTGYSQAIAAAAVGHFSAKDVPLNFRILATFLPQLPDGPAKDQVISAAEAIFAAHQELNTLKDQKVQPKQIPAYGQQVSEPAVQQHDQVVQLTRQNWDYQIRDEALTMIRTESQKAAGKQTLSAKEMETVTQKVREEMNARLAIGDYQKTVNGYVKAGNQQAYFQRVRAERQKMMPSAIRRAVQDVIEARPKGQPQQQPAKQVQKTQTSEAAPMQFRRISGPPKTLNLKVDLRRTTNAMILKRQAYIQGEEKPVTWARV